MDAAIQRAVNAPPSMGMKASKLSYLLRAAEEWAKSAAPRDPTPEEIIALRELVLHVAPKNHDLIRGPMDR